MAQRRSTVSTVIPPPPASYDALVTHLASVNTTPWASRRRQRPAGHGPREPPAVFFCCLLGLKILLGVCGGISTVFQAVLELFGYPMSALRGGATGSGPSGA